MDYNYDMFRQRKHNFNKNDSIYYTNLDHHFNVREYYSGGEKYILEIFEWLYDLSYEVFNIVSEMIAPNRYIDIIISAEDLTNLEGVSYTNAIVIFPYAIVNIYPSNLWNTAIINTICHELYHCVLTQDNNKYSESKEFHDLIEQQTDYMALQFIIKHRDLLESRLNLVIDVPSLKLLYTINHKTVFCKNISDIKHMDLRRVWLECIFLGNLNSMPSDFIESFDKCPNVDIQIYSAVYDGEKDDLLNVKMNELTFSEERYMIEDVVKENNIFLPPCIDLISIRMQSNCTLNDNILGDQTFSLRWFEEEDKLHILQIHVRRRIPFFIKKE